MGELKPDLAIREFHTDLLSRFVTTEDPSDFASSCVIAFERQRKEWAETDRHRALDVEAVLRVAEEIASARREPGVSGATWDEPGLKFGSDPIYLMGMLAAFKYWADVLKKAVGKEEGS